MHPLHVHAGLEQCSDSSLCFRTVLQSRFQRVEVTAPEWDSPSECEKESTVDEALLQLSLDIKLHE